MKISRELISNILFSISFSILIFIFCVFFFSFTGFIFHIPVNAFYSLLSFLIGFGVLYYLIKSKTARIDIHIYTLFSYFMIFVVALLFGQNFLDSSYDGQTYHQAGIMLLGQGWNPVYDNLVEFSEKLYNTELDHLIWVENYQKFAEIIWTNIFVIFHKIEVSKMTNLLSGFMLFGYVFYILNKDKFNDINTVAKILISFLFVLNPVFVAQVVTFYSDNYVYIFFMMILFAIIDIEISKEKNLLPFLIIIMSSICLVNVKMGGVLCVVVSIIIYSFYIIFLKQKNKLKKIGLSLFIILIFTLISGINPYYTNIKQDRNPFYPLLGKDKIDVVAPSTPSAIYNKNNFQKFILSTLFKVDNSMPYEKKENNIKIPFSVHKSELSVLSDPDIRISGFGLFWSGIVLLSGILAIFIRYKSKEDKRLFSLIFLILILLTVFNPCSWWARYAPHLWAIPLFIIVSSFISKNKIIFIKILASIIIFVMFINLFIQIKYIYKREIHYKNYMTNTIQNLKKAEYPIKIYYICDWAMIQKFLENNINFELVDNEYYLNHIEDFSLMHIVLHHKMYWNYRY